MHKARCDKLSISCFWVAATHTANNKERPRCATRLKYDIPSFENYIFYYYRLDDAPPKINNTIYFSFPVTNKRNV